MEGQSLTLGNLHAIFKSAESMTMSAPQGYNRSMLKGVISINEFITRIQSLQPAKPIDQ